MNKFAGPNVKIEEFELPGWAGALGTAGAVSGADGVASMAQVATARSPRHLHKRRRLSRLLDRLAVQLHRTDNLNNNHYPPPLEADDAPLDLSVKPEPPPAAARPSFACGACDQTFAVHDRLAKHIASRHRVPGARAAAGARAVRGSRDEPSRAYECEVCRRRFARSDMLTRHARLHSGVKPYSCAVCGQVFSRSDHLATHQRTHTGEKPYRCPACPYAACRRDMITRHMRTHSRRPQPA